MGIAPERPTPDTAYAGTAGGTGVANVQSESEAKIRAAGRAGVDAAYGDGRNNMTNNLFGGFGNGIGGLVAMLVQGAFGIIGGVADLIGGLLGIRNKADNASQQVAEQAGSIEGLEVRVTALEGGGTRTVYSSNFVWENPGSGTVKVAVFNGGQCGQDSRQSNTAIGGVHGGYQLKEFRCADLPATVNGAVGAGGVTNLQAGGTTSFGTYLVGLSGAPGSILTKEGAVASTSAPGSGGDGGLSQSNGFKGGASALADGGNGGAGTTAGAGGNGQPGQSVPIESDVPCGGGGGGGGGSFGGAFGDPGDGGAGGAPGGGGGGGGSKTNLNPAGVGPGGPGANGRLIIIYTPGGAVA
ncbi:MULTISPECIES: glycine-rich domain-containing protein [Nocardiaceae]|uniref:glycine-rich domain-containing protein n=1 Tax=Nocardiaceae TaxID=85025 RepID=UPI00068AAB2D|nr:MULTISPECIES: hypothetical protein [Rhodococcus]